MSWFSKDKVHPILKHADYTAILGVEVQNGRLAKLCYTGHAGELSAKGVVQAIVPGGALLWRAEFAEEYDVRDGHVAVANGIVVTRTAAGNGHVLIGHELWTGAERWRRPVGRMVSRMGLDGRGSLVFVTFDHAVHAVSIATGEDTLGEPVMTDQARDAVINSTQHPTAQWSTGDRARTAKDWSRVYQPANGLMVYERDWAGTREFGVGDEHHSHIVGSGSYEGAMAVDNVVVVGFKLDRDGTTHHHWYLYATNPLAQLGVLREDGQSELFEGGRSVWQGKL
jgi:hypothetical protein